MRESTAPRCGCNAPAVDRDIVPLGGEAGADLLDVALDRRRTWPECPFWPTMAIFHRALPSRTGPLPGLEMGYAPAPGSSR